MQHPDKNTCNIYVKHMQHQNKHTCNILLKKQMKHLEQTFATYITSRSTSATSIRNTYNIPLKHVKHFKHTLATCAFQQNLVSRRTEHHTTRSSCAVAVEKEDSSRRTTALPPASGTRSGGDSGGWTVATSRGEATAAMRAQGSTPRRHGCGAGVVARLRWMGSRTGTGEQRVFFFATRAGQLVRMWGVQVGVQAHQEKRPGGRTYASALPFI
jgi:hypothetical protein